MNELYHFLGLTDYYKRFTQLFAEITKPLNKLLKKATKFQWSAQRKSAFEHFNKALSMRPILQCPSAEKLFTLSTDASHYAYPGVFTQAVDSPDDLKPIAYTSG